MVDRGEPRDDLGVTLAELLALAWRRRTWSFTTSASTRKRVYELMEEYGIPTKEKAGG